MVKLNIEMSMADMIIKVAKSNEQDMNPNSSSQGTPYPGQTQRSQHNHTFNEDHDDTKIPTNGVTNNTFIGHTQGDEALREDIKGIARQTEVQVFVGDSDSESRSIDLEQGKPSARDFTRDNSRHSRLSDDSQIPMHDMRSPTGRAA